METNDNKIKRKGLMFVLSSPSGAGKTSLSRKLLELDDELFLSISYTTRPPRPGEIDGEDYFFINNDDFALMQEKNEFLEYAKVFDYYYGTPRKPVEKIEIIKDDKSSDAKLLATFVNKIKRKGLMFVLSSPSGAGKTSLSRKLIQMKNFMK